LYSVAKEEGRKGGREKGALADVKEVEWGHIQHTCSSYIDNLVFRDDLCEQSGTLLYGLDE
jgi:hypothetical protein